VSYQASVWAASTTSLSFDTHHPMATVFEPDQIDEWLPPVMQALTEKGRVIKRIKDFHLDRVILAFFGKNNDVSHSHNNSAKDTNAGAGSSIFDDVDENEMTDDFHLTSGTQIDYCCSHQ
jgi:hypothetical protein